MPEMMLVPSIEKRLNGFIEVSRRHLQQEGKKAGTKSTITISREFGCEAYPVAEYLKTIMEEKTGESWLLVDRALLDVVAKDNDLTADILHSLGKKPRWLDEMLSALSPRWKNEKDYYALLCEEIVAIAKNGNAIIVGLGSAIVAQELRNCMHFRLYASTEFKIKSIAKRMKIAPQDAELLIEKRQKERDKFVRNFLDADTRDYRFYNLVFNNDRSSTRLIAETISGYVLNSR